MLSEGADPNLAFPGYSTPLVYIARSATYLHYPIIQLLLERGADPLQPEPTEENTEQTALSLARSSNPEICVQMMWHSAAARPERQHLLPPVWNSPLVRNVDDDDASHDPGLVDAATHDQIELSFMLAVLKDDNIKLFALVNTLTPDARGDLVRKTARFAARIGRNSIVLSLVGDQTVDRDELIWDAARTDNLTLLHLLLEGYPVDSPMQIEVFNRAMLLASLFDNISVVEVLLDKCVDNQPPLLPHEAHSEITWPKFVAGATYNGHLDVLELLLTQVPQDFNFGEALNLAAANGHLDIVTSLLKKGALRDNSGEVALKNAVIGGHSKVVDELLAYGACTPEFFSELKPVFASFFLSLSTVLLNIFLIFFGLTSLTPLFAISLITTIEAVGCNFFIVFFIINFLFTIFPNYLEFWLVDDPIFSPFRIPIFFTVLSIVIPSVLIAIITFQPMITFFLIVSSIHIGMSALPSAIGVNFFILTCKRATSLSFHRALLAACGFYKTKSPDEVPNSDDPEQPVPSV